MFYAYRVKRIGDFISSFIYMGINGFILRINLHLNLDLYLPVCMLLQILKFKSISNHFIYIYSSKRDPCLAKMINNLFTKFSRMLT